MGGSTKMVAVVVLVQTILLLIQTSSAGSGSGFRYPAFYARVPWYYCPTVIPEDCSQLYARGEKRSGVYLIQPVSGLAPFNVYCDMCTEPGGWTVFQYRRTGEVDFYNCWYLYKVGFGSLCSEFWLGLHYLHALTSTRPTRLRIELHNNCGQIEYAEYCGFEIDCEYNNYRMSYSCNCAGSMGGDSPSLNNNADFSTKDRDNDEKCNFDCAQYHRGAWWYSDADCDRCTDSNLNGDYNGCKWWQRPFWRAAYPDFPFTGTEMKIHRECGY